MESAKGQMDNIIIARVKRLANVKGVKPTTAMVESGVGKNFFANIRQGHEPSAEKINKLAVYFGVSADYILGNTNVLTYTEQGAQGRAPREAEMRLREVAKSFDNDMLEKLLDYADYLKHSQKK